MRLIRTTLSTALARLRRLPGSEEGFTMIAALGVMAMTTVLVTTAFVAAEGDLNLTQRDLDNKSAYFAAQGGVNEFLYQLKQDPNYWDDCPSKDSTPIPGSKDEDDLDYSYAPVPANGSSSCQSSNPIDTMIDEGTGTFRMRFTGTSSDSSRSLVASFRRNSPLDFLWYTIYETLDPNVYPNPAFAQANCARWHRPVGSTPARTVAWSPPQGSPGAVAYCGDIDFISADNMKGPMFTQDQFATCGSPIFGRDSNDQIKSMGSPVSYASCGGSAPQFRGQPVANSSLVDLPPANAALRDDAQSSGIIYKGPTRIEFLGSTTARITNADAGLNNATVNLPPIIYVENSTAGCSASYSPYTVGNDYSLSGGCGDVHVSGNYTQPITIAATNDIIVRGNLCAQACSTSSPTGQAILGLVANNFVRVMHGRSGRTSRANCGSFDSATTPPNPTHIDAAILALQHSFIVDNYDCGSALGSLQVIGAIAQKFRGTVGTHSGSTVTSGYTKDYTYDNRLATRTPPFLFDLNESSWRVERETLCVLGGSATSTRC